MRAAMEGINAGISQDSLLLARWYLLYRILPSNRHDVCQLYLPSCLKVLPSRYPVVPCNAPNALSERHAQAKMITYSY